MEVREFRCCMCPNIGTDNMICPTGPLKNNETQCNFVVVWMDARGWKYKVMRGLGDNNYKGRYQDDKHVGTVGWKSMRQLDWKKTFDAAQEELNRLATSKGWEPMVI